MTTPADRASATALESAVLDALGKVQDPEIRMPVTDLDMIADVTEDAGRVTVTVRLTVAHCPLRQTLEDDVHAAAAAVPGVAAAEVVLDVMTPEQRRVLVDQLRTRGGTRDIPFNRPESGTRVIGVASGKGGVGKSTVTSNLAVAMAADGLSVGIIDADIYGFSIPGMLGIDYQPTKLDEGMLLPPIGHGVRVMSIGLMVGEGQAVVWRGPKLHRAVEQFATDVFWGDLDVLLIDLPPGTGDVAISVAQLLPTTELLVVTTPQQVAATVAERSAALRQPVLGVVENMSWLELDDGTRMQVFGAGGGASTAAAISERTEREVPLLAQVPLESSLREGGDAGDPVVLSAPASPAARVLRGLAGRLSAAS